MGPVYRGGLTGDGCSPTANLLENTPTYKDNGYAEYLRVKQEFDKLNYGTTKNPQYVFNPWVVLIHGGKYVDAPNVYAYSVDDAVGDHPGGRLGLHRRCGKHEEFGKPPSGCPADHD